MENQHPFTIMTEILPGHTEVLGTMLDGIGNDIKANPYIHFGDFAALHYGSLVVFEPVGGAPFLLFEGNVDGQANEFWSDLIRKSGHAVDEIYSHCVGYPAMGSVKQAEVLAYFREHDIKVNTYYIGCPGHTVGDIMQEQNLRDRIRELLDTWHSDRPYDHSHGSMVAEPAQNLAPYSVRTAIEDMVRQDHSLSWALQTSQPPFLVRHGRKVTLAGLVGLVAVAFIAAATGILAGLGWMVAGIGACVVAGPLIWLGQLRWHERNDDRIEAARPDWQTRYNRWNANIATIAQRENVQGQNHLASITQVKPGRFRLLTLRVVLWAINLVARLLANRGRLGGISSIHFARWVLTADHRHLIFLSNFDGSWESYLGDFIDLASSGLTAVWTSTDNDIGFPSTRLLIKDGARDEQRFKAFARYSQARTRVWYSAYPNVSMQNIANNSAIRRGLFAHLNQKEEQTWLRRL